MLDRRREVPSFEWQICIYVMFMDVVILLCSQTSLRHLSDCLGLSIRPVRSLDGVAELGGLVSDALSLRDRLRDVLRALKRLPDVLNESGARCLKRMQNQPMGSPSLG